VRESATVAPIKDDRFDAFVLADTLRHTYNGGQGQLYDRFLATDVYEYNNNGTYKDGNAWSCDFGTTNAGDTVECHAHMPYNLLGTTYYKGRLAVCIQVDAGTSVKCTGYLWSLPHS
jgi:hypothetical protein